jgi:arylsulfatase
MAAARKGNGQVNGNGRKPNGVAGCRHGKLPWTTAGTAPFDDDAWELYDIEKDFTQANDLAKTDPKRLRAMQDLFVAEAAKHNVLPLDDRFA